MNIFLINHYAGSPRMGMEFRPYYLAKEWVAMGHNVTILAANFSHIRNINPVLRQDMKVEIIDNIRYIWINTPRYEGNGLGRIKNMLAFIRKTLFKVSYFIKNYKPDVVIASSTYPSDNYVARKIAKLSGAKYIYEVHDLWPLSPVELGGMSKSHPFILAMQHAENFAYRKADAVISMLPKTQEHMKNHGLDLNKWHYIPNGIVSDEWKNKKELNIDTAKKINEIKSNFAKIVAYTGTLGLANALDTFVLSAKDLPDIAYVIVGKGPEKDRLKKLIEKENLKNVFILDAVHKQEIPALLSMFDFLYIGLQYQPLFRFGISPNKLIDYMMAGKPIIQAINAGNNVVKEVGCGIDIEPENPDAIVKAIQELLSLSPGELKQKGENGRQFVVKHHDYHVLARQFIDVIKKGSRKD
jgi:glycosyltransferase involved in cell wall biosynthesis